jgi:hypothetical protein
MMNSFRTRPEGSRSRREGKTEGVVPDTESLHVGQPTACEDHMGRLPEGSSEAVMSETDRDWQAKLRNCVVSSYETGLFETSLEELTKVINERQSGILTSDSLKVLDEECERFCTKQLGASYKKK